MELLVLILGGAFIVVLVTREYLRQRRYDNSPEFEMRATLLSRHDRGETHYGKPYTAYYGTFETEQGEIVVLKTHRDFYYTIQEGTSGILTWKDGQLENFEVEK